MAQDDVTGREDGRNSDGEEFRYCSFLFLCNVVVGQFPHALVSLDVFDSRTNTVVSNSGLRAKCSP